MKTSLFAQVILGEKGNDSFRAIDALLTPPSLAVRLGTGPCSTLGASLRDLLFSEQRADVHFSVGGEIIPAHAVVLKIRSVYFRSMFTAGMAEANGSVVKVEGHSPDAFRALLSYLYTGEVQVEPELLPAVMMVAGQYLATELHGVALRMALRCIGTHNAVSWLVTAHVNPEHLAVLKTSALHWVVVQYDECTAACVEGAAQLLSAHLELMLEVTGLIHSRLRESLKRKSESDV